MNKNLVKEIPEEKMASDKEVEDFYVDMAVEINNFLDKLFRDNGGNEDWLEFWRVEKFILAIVSNADRFILELADDHQKMADDLRWQMIRVLGRHNGESMEKMTMRAEVHEAVNELATTMAEAEAEHATKN